MSLLDMISSQLGDDAVRQLSQRLGADHRTTSSAVSSALPVLVGALAKNSANRDGAASLASALDRDHDGGLLDDVAGFFNQAPADAGEGMLGHILGGRRPATEKALAENSGLDAGQVGQLLSMLAPLVLGALSKQKQRQGLDPGGLAGMLGGEMGRVRKQAPAGSLGVLGLLDADGDGQVVDDLAEKGLGLLGKMFSNRR